MTEKILRLAPEGDDEHAADECASAYSNGGARPTGPPARAVKNVIDASGDPADTLTPCPTVHGSTDIAYATAIAMGGVLTPSVPSDSSGDPCDPGYLR